MNAIPFRPKFSTSPPKVPTSDLQLWIKDLSRGNNSPSTFSYFGTVWTGFRVKRWVVISGDSDSAEQYNEPASQAMNGQPFPRDIPVNTVSAQRTEIYKKDEFPRPRRALTASENDNFLLSQQSSSFGPTFDTPGTPDWTLPQPIGQLSSHVIFARSIDWAATPLGDMKTW